MSERIITDLLGLVARSVLPEGASDAAAADLLGELLVALRIHDNLTRGVIPPRGSVKRRSRGLIGLETAVADAVRRSRPASLARPGMPGTPGMQVSPVMPGTSGTPATPVRPATGQPARLPVQLAAVATDLQPAATSDQEEITLRVAADLLGLKSTERVRQLAAAGELDAVQQAYGRRAWRVTRGSVANYVRRRSVQHGTGDPRSAGQQAAA